MNDAVAEWKRDMTAWQLRVADWLALDPRQLTDIDVEVGPPLVVTWTSVGAELRARSGLGRQEASQVSQMGDEPAVIRSRLVLPPGQVAAVAGERPKFPDLGLPPD